MKKSFYLGIKRGSINSNDEASSCDGDEYCTCPRCLKQHTRRGAVIPLEATASQEE